MRGVLEVGGRRLRVGSPDGCRAFSGALYRRATVIPYGRHRGLVTCRRDRVPIAGHVVRETRCRGSLCCRRMLRSAAYVRLHVGPGRRAAAIEIRPNTVDVHGKVTWDHPIRPAELHAIRSRLQASEASRSLRPSSCIVGGELQDDHATDSTPCVAGRLLGAAGPWSLPLAAGHAAVVPRVA